MSPLEWMPDHFRMMTRRRASELLLNAGLAIALPLLLAGTAGAAGKLEYKRDIRPILAENCFACHGPDSAARKAELRLDRREAAIEAGAITPGDLAASELIARINTNNPKEVMPPPSLHKTLTAQQKDVLRRWIEAGAEYQLHWSLIPPTRPTPPRVKDESWIRNPIDRFVLAKLEKQGLRPAAEADRRTLARRLSLDLTGLPPGPADVEAFVSDASADAYAKFVDRLLESPRWGEHRARYWLDAARYADTHGYHFDNYREMWSYRDWVISAFNRNLSFEQFTIEQLAGDLLPDRTLDQQIASGFNRCNMTTNEGGTIPEENLVSYTRDRTETVSQVWLGLTANCAVCHDHKFDPLTQREFYELAAFFNNTIQGALDDNIKDTPPAVFVPSAADRDRWSALPAELGALRSRIESRTAAARPELAKWLAGQTRDSLTALIPARELRLNVGSSPRDDAASGQAQDHVRPIFESADSGDFERKEAFSFGAWIKLTKGGLYGSVVARMDDQHDYRGWDLWIEDKKVATHLVNKWPENALKVVGRAEIPLNTWTHVLVTYDGSSQAAGVKIYINGEAQATEIAANQLNNTIRTSVPLKVGQRHTSARLDDVGISEVRIYRLLLAPGEAADLAAAGRALTLLGKPTQQRLRAETDALLTWWFEDPGSRLERTPGQASCPGTGGGRDPVARDRRARDAGADRAGHGVRSLPRRVRQAARPGEARYAGCPAHDARGPSSQPAWPCPVAASAGTSPDRPGHRQPLLAGNLRNRTGAHGGRFRHQRRTPLAPRAP
jgi:mono/diheme cytochrome c family protein